MLTLIFRTVLAHILAAEDGIPPEPAQRSLEQKTRIDKGTS
jgi:hypothetical protein